MEGVKAFFSAKDIPGINNFMTSKMLLVVEQEEIFCSGLVKYYGQPVGVIVADSLVLSERAAEQVRIEYSPSIKTFYVDERDVLEKDNKAPRVNFVGGYDATAKGII